MEDLFSCQEQNRLCVQRFFLCVKSRFWYQSPSSVVAEPLSPSPQDDKRNRAHARGAIPPPKADIKCPIALNRPLRGPQSILIPLWYQTPLEQFKAKLLISLRKSGTSDPLVSFPGITPPPWSWLCLPRKCRVKHRSRAGEPPQRGAGALTLPHDPSERAPQRQLGIPPYPFPVYSIGTPLSQTRKNPQNLSDSMLV